MRPTIAVIRLSALAQNLETVARLAPASRIMAVVKSNAYGHGMARVAEALRPEADAFAVAFLDEAVRLRDSGLDAPILVLEGTTCNGDVSEAAARDFWLLVHDIRQVDQLLTARVSQPITAWLKIDTGLHRLGLSPAEATTAIEALSASANVRQPLTLCTHLACADEAGNPMTKTQTATLRSLGSRFNLPLSIANSAGILFCPGSRADWNRPGYMLYGNNPDGSTDAAKVGLSPVMTMRSEIIALRKVAAGAGVGYGQTWRAAVPSIIGTVPIGYGDGYPRHAPNGTPVLVNGRPAALAGRVSMDMITVDLTGLGEVHVGDPVELWGKDLSVNEVAACAGTIGYELLAGLSGRVPLVYVP